MNGNEIKWMGSSLLGVQDVVICPPTSRRRHTAFATFPTADAARRAFDLCSPVVYQGIPMAVVFCREEEMQDAIKKEE